MNSSLILPVKQSSLAAVNHPHSAIDPFVFMDRKEPEILHRLPREYEYSDVGAAEFFCSLKENLKKLKSFRRCKIKTADHLNDIIIDLPAKIRLFTILFLLKVLDADESWMHTYNYLVQSANRDLPRPMEFKFMPEHELMALIDQDEEEPLIFEEHALEKFHPIFNDGFLWQKAGLETFKDWFRIKPVGRPVIKEEMITYFCYAVWQINDYRITEVCPNIEDWYYALTGKKTTFSKLKGSAVGKNKIEVDRRIANLTRSLNG